MIPPPDPSAVASDETELTGAEIAERLCAWPEGMLYMEIGLRAEALRLDPARAFPWSPAAAPPVDGRTAFPGLERLGERLVHRLDLQIDALIAGDEKIDELERRRLLGACALAARESAAEIAAALVAGFGLAPPIAPLAAVALCHRGAPARWPSLSGRRRRDALLTIERMAAPKP